MNDDKQNVRGYRVIRFFHGKKMQDKIMRRNLTLAEAKAWCARPESSVKDCYFDRYVFIPQDETLNKINQRWKKV